MSIVPVTDITDYRNMKMREMSVEDIRHIVYQHDYIRSTRKYGSYTQLKQAQFNCMVQKRLVGVSECSTCDFDMVCVSRNFFGGLV